jgi:hypothetical protein
MIITRVVALDGILIQGGVWIQIRNLDLGAGSKGKKKNTKQPFIIQYFNFFMIKEKFLI